MAHNKRSEFHINVETAYQEQIRPEKPNSEKVERRRRIEAAQEQKRINNEFKL